MQLLVLGGGGFLGHHAVAEAVAAGHEVTVFSRTTGSGVEGVEVLQGDRGGDLSVLRGRSWDSVLDTFSDPAAVAASARLLSGSVGAYGYVSGMSVYAPGGPAVPDESAPVRGPDDTGVLQERSVAKLACEEAVRAGFDGPVLATRVGIMVGPRDPSDRMTWWPVRFARALAGTADRAVLAPGDPSRPVQYSDARDLAAWMVRMLDAGHGGLFNGVGPGRPDTVGEVLAACLRAAGGEPGDVELVWAGESFLREGLAGMEEEERPLWFPEDQIPQRAIDSTAALAAGLAFRSPYETARDTLDWARGTGHDGDLAAGFSADRERELLTRWTAPAGPGPLPFPT